MTALRRSIRLIPLLAVLAFAASPSPVCAQPPEPDTATLTGHVILRAVDSKSHPPSIVAWLTPVGNNPSVEEPRPGQFTLLQKNRMFKPHLLIVPVGSVVSFPNQDPFFHNVFSLFNGRRFDLGLYEAGSSREVKFSQEGISYIFCNIHPQMSAVVIALATPLYAVADAAGSFSIHSAPPGIFELHVWIEGTPQPDFAHLSRTITLAAGQSASVTIDASGVDHSIPDHLNKFGKPYPPDTRPPY